ncbi:MAG TPA: cysteinyl-tRNA synthetase, partial [Dehalococcoidia bacterium]|nr:cysteinyl-tRNA synthetase [Dehalococcoidia bacterium]
MRLGKIVLFGSGETSASGRTVHDRLMAELPPPVVVAILETPAGFQPNSEHVAREVGEFITTRLQNYQPEVRIVPARKKGTPFSPDDPLLLEPMLDANYIFLGPGSPTYTARNLEGTLALEYLLERHKAGAVLCFASAATLAVGAKVLPVYEIFKAGSGLYWADGLNAFAAFGLELAIVPHWNNTDGGVHLDTSRCFMGRERMDQLRQLLPASTVLLGIDEHTALVFDLQQGRGLVLGKGTVTVGSDSKEKTYSTGDSF